jgi:hypothetical protein
VNRFRLALTRLWIPLVLVAVPAAAQSARPASRPAPGATRGTESDPSRLQMNVMEDAFQRAVEGVHGRALEALQVGAGMPAMFMLDGNTRARAFRLDGYGVFFDVDLPPIPRSVEWSLRVLDTGAVLVGDIQQLQAQIDQLNDPGVKRLLEPIVRNMRAKVAMTASASGRAGEPADGVRPALVSDSAPPDPFARYVIELKQTLGQILLEYGPTIQLGADDWLTVAAREMSPKLMPGNPTDATIILRMKGSDLTALKAGRLSREEAARRIEVKELY